MEYFKLLNLEKEPFSNSPDPDYFFKSRQHEGCLQKIELALRLRRGLNVVIGDVGTGKTTLCRQLIKKFGDDEKFETHLILDPHIPDPAAFLKYVAEMFERRPAVDTGNWADYKEFIKKYLFKRGVDENKVVVLIIDEGQKIPSPILEILRELLNYETNEYKLLQIVIFAQREFEEILEKHANFADRINRLYMLGPLGFWDTRLMIDYRLHKAGLESSLQSMLSFPALVAIFRATGGYPRKIVNLCHRVMMAMIVQNKKRAGRRLVRSCVSRSRSKDDGGWWKTAGAILAVVGLAGVIYVGFPPGKLEPVGETSVRQVFPIVKETGKMPVEPATDNSVKRSPAAADLEQEQTPAVESTGEITAKQEYSGIADEKAPEKVTVLPASTREAVATRPQTLGIIRMKKNEILSWVMIKVYGEYTNLRLQEVADSNPGVNDMDDLFSGQAIGFPAIAYEGIILPGFLNWIRVDRVGTISAALEIVRRHSTKAAPLRIIPHWNRDQGLLFDVIFWKYFSSRGGAERYLTKLPDSVRIKSEIIQGWDKAELFYANPYPVSAEGENLRWD